MAQLGVRPLYEYFAGKRVFVTGDTGFKALGYALGSLRWEPRFEA